MNSVLRFCSLSARTVGLLVGLLILLQLKLLYNFHISSRVIIRDAMSYQRNENEETKRPYHDSSGISSRPSCHVKNGMASSNLKKPFRVLFTDIWFPVAYSKWRLEEIFSFMQIFHTDILVDRSKLIRKDQFPPNYEAVSDRFHLADLYDVLIFDPKFNYLNVYNKDDFNGTIFNGIIPASYMLRRRDYREQDFVSKNHAITFSEYDACYHLFLALYRQFSWIPIPSERQWIHAYPGGGLSRKNDLKGIPSDVGIVITQVTTLNWISELQLNNTVVMALGGSYLQKETKLIPKSYSASKKIGICFTQMSGDSVFKGDDIFANAIRWFSKNHPDLRNETQVYTVGRSSHVDGGIAMGMMEQNDLDEFYKSSVDIYINTETGKALNGWPLGIEALIQGAVGIQMDPLGMNSGWGFTDEEMFILRSESDLVSQIGSILVKLVQDRHLLHRMSLKSQKKIFDLLAYEKSQANVFRALTTRICKQHNEILL
jgi:hypothetical protein